MEERRAARRSATNAFIRGRAKVVRVEEISGTEQRGVGAFIERYRFGVC